MERPTKRQQRTVGAIVKVPLEDGYHTYARILADTFAFYDARTKTNITDLKEIISKPILFITAVYDYAINQGLWLKIGKIPLEEKLMVEPEFFIQDSIKPDQFSILESDGITIRSASRDECIGLERATVWTPESIAERINDYYAERPNFWVESMKRLELFPKMKNENIRSSNIREMVAETPLKQAV